MNFLKPMIVAGLFFLSCDRGLIEPVVSNPFDLENESTDGYPFVLTTVNYSDHIQITWAYDFASPILEMYNLYRLQNMSDGPSLLYTGIETVYEDTTVFWDSTYSYYVTAMVGTTESPSPEIAQLEQVIRRIYVGSGQDYETIQEAIDALENGDIIYVKDGTYTESIKFQGKEIILYSENGPNNCILDGGDTDRLIEIVDNMGAIVIEGFTIQNGNMSEGGGIYCKYSNSLKIKNCIIKDNNSSQKGGGIYISESESIIIEQTVFLNNESEEGAAIFVENSDGVNLENCLIHSNHCTFGGNGNGIYTLGLASLTITNCTIFSNFGGAYYGGGIFISESYIDVENSIIMGNNALIEGNDFYFDLSSNVEINYSDIDNNFGLGCSSETCYWSGFENINTGVNLVGFIDPDDFDFHLQNNTPCVDHGNPDPSFNDVDSTRNDMGAYGGPGGEW